MNDAVTQASASGSPQDIRRYPCAACGAKLVYEPRDGFLSCPYCGHKEIIPQTADQIVEHSFEQYLQIRPEQMQQLAANALEVRCQSCGAMVTFVPPEVAKRCDFCGVDIVTQATSADPILAPEGVLPFRITQKQATEGLRRWLRTRWFAPNALKRFAQPDAISGVYLPFWTYDTNTTSFYNGERGVYYSVTETYTENDAQGQPVTRTRQVQQIRWEPVSGTLSRWFDDVLIAATTALQIDRLEALEPWDLTELKPYDQAFLAGFKAQRYQIDLPTGFERVKQITARAIKDDVRVAIGGKQQRIHNIATHHDAITFKHLLLPVYAGAYRFNQKVYQIVVNGRTGEIQGDRPYSFWKIALFVASIIVVLLVLGLIVGLLKS